MELPHLGKQCTQSSCKKLDFLPITCDACNQIFCDEHYKYATHNCQKAYLKNNQVPVCPLCNTPIPVPRDQLPDYAVGAHIDNDCKSDQAKNRRKVFTNKCSRKGCKTKEIVPVICRECKMNYCFKHRHTTDHDCLGSRGAMRNQTLDAALSRQNGISSQQPNYTNSIQGNISEDEALARALALSMQYSQASTTDQEQILNINGEYQRNGSALENRRSKSALCRLQ